MLKQPNIQNTIMLMEEYHRGQTYGRKAYLNGHLVPVANEARLVLAREQQGIKPTVDDKETVCLIGLLHDSLEDTSMTSDKLLELGYSQEIVDSVIAITKLPQQSWKDYLRQVKKNKLALIVKKADTFINLQNSYKDGNYSRIKKYTEQLSFLFKDS